MRALICSRLDGPDSLEVGELPEPDLPDGAVRVQVEATGANFPDLLIIRGLYQEKPSLPFAPGMEVAGTVAEVAPGVEHVAVGDRVYAFVGWGGFAEQVVVDAHQVFEAPDGMSAETAAALPIAYGTSYHALIDRAHLEKGEILLVLGAAGGVGLAAIQIGTAVGARVVAAVSSDAKEEAVRASGATDVIRYDREDLRGRLRDLAPEGVDVVYDPVGGDVTETAFRSLGWEGRHLVIGFAGGDIPSVPANLALLKGASLVGVFWGRFASMFPDRNHANFQTLNEWWTSGRIDPTVSEVFELDRAVEALRRLESRQAIGKLIVRP
jgi:NADPH2:quinone reductase